MNMKEKSSYIKGLLEGLAIDETKPEGKVIAALVDMVDALSEEVENLKADMEDYGEYVEELDEDLGMVEEIVYDLDDEDECDFDCENCDDGDCEFRDGDFYCAVCPNCGEKIYFDESADPSEIICPSCKTPLEPEEDEEEKED